MIDNFKELMKSQYFKNTANGFILKDNQSRMKVVVTGVPLDGVLLNIPAQGISHSGLVREKKGYRKSCDQLLLVNNKNCIEAYLIELKKGINDDEIIEEACDQIIATIPVLQYIVSMLNVHFNSKQIIKHYYVVIAKKSSLKFNKPRVKHLGSKKISHKRKKFKIIYSTKSIPLTILK